MAAQPCWPWRRKARGNAGERLCSRFGSALTSASCPLGKLAAEEEAEALAEDQPAALAAQLGARAAARSSRNNWPSRRAKRSTVSSRRPGAGRGGSRDAAGEIARAVPGLQGQARAAHFEAEVSPVRGSSSSPGSAGRARGSPARNA